MTPRYSRRLWHTVSVSTPLLVAFDLDDTLAPSKSPIDPSMARLLVRLLEVVEVCIISGGQFQQFQTQVIDAAAARRSRGARPPASDAHLRHAVLPLRRRQPARGVLAPAVRREPHERAEEGRALGALESEAKRLGLWADETWGDILEDRGSQITFSALGQHAPVEAKKAWDPTGEKKNTLREAVQKLLPDLEVRSGGSTSIDITRMGIDKAYGINKLAELTGISIDDMLFVGDRLDPDGNDYPVKALGVPTHAVENWHDTAQFIEGFLADRTP